MFLQGAAITSHHHITGGNEKESIHRCALSLTCTGCTQARQDSFLLSLLKGPHFGLDVCFISHFSSDQPAIFTRGQCAGPHLVGLLVLSLHTTVLVGPSGQSRDLDGYEGDANPDKGRKN